MVELPKVEVFALSVFVTAEEIHDLPFAGDVADFLRGTRSCPCRFALGRFAVQSAGIHEIFDRLLESPSAGVEIHVNSNASSTIAGQAQNLSLRRRVVWIKTGAHQHLFSVERPAFDEHGIAMLTADFVA